MTDAELKIQLREAVQQEREVSRQVLFLVREAEDRRLPLREKCSNTIKWLVRDFGYSEPAARRRVAAARLLRDVPSLAAKLVAGTVSLTSLCQAQSAIQSEEKRTKARLSAEEKQVVAQAIEGQNYSGTERALVELFPMHNPSQPEKVKPVAGKMVALTIELTEAEFALLQRVREMRSHANKTWGSAVGHLASEFIKRHDSLAERHCATAAAVQSVTPARKRAVLQRDHHQCVICQERGFPQVDHIIPQAAGGTNDMSNLRTVCRAHNQWLAEQWFGRAFIEKKRNLAMPILRQ